MLAVYGVSLLRLLSGKLRGRLAVEVADLKQAPPEPCSVKPWPRNRWQCDNLKLSYGAKTGRGAQAVGNVTA